MMCSEHDITHKLYDAIDQLASREEKWFFYVHTSTTSVPWRVARFYLTICEQGHVLILIMNHVVYIWFSDGRNGDFSTNSSDGITAAWIQGWIIWDLDAIARIESEKSDITCNDTCIVSCLHFSARHNKFMDNNLFLPDLTTCVWQQGAIAYCILEIWQLAKTSFGRFLLVQTCTCDCIFEQKTSLWLELVSLLILHTPHDIVQL